FDKAREAYRALETLLGDGKVRAIEISNSTTSPRSSTRRRSSLGQPGRGTPRLHPASGAGVRRRARILTEAWSAIRGITFYRDSGHGSTLQNPVIGKMPQERAAVASQSRWRTPKGSISQAPRMALISTCRALGDLGVGCTTTRGTDISSAGAVRTRADRVAM